MNPKKPRIPAHGTGRNTCKKCDVPHTINEHRFHTRENGDVRRDVFCKTHKGDSRCVQKNVTSGMGMFDQLAKDVDSVLKEILRV